MPAFGLIVLAAGGSSRLGQPKQLVRYQGQTLLRRTAETALASACRPVIVVLGAHASQMQVELSGLSVHTAENTQWAAGMGSSIRTGLLALCEIAKVDGVVITLCDQPLLTHAHIDTLIASYQQSHSPIIASEYAGTLGVPAFFSHDLFAELLSLQDEEGAKKIILRHPQEVTQVAFPEGVLDIDTPEDVARLG